MNALPTDARSTDLARRRPRWPWLAVLPALVGASLLTSLPSTQAARVAGNSFEVLVGRDDDNTANPIVQPAGTVADQSLANTDVLVAQGAQNILIGLAGSDVLQGGPASDILVGGTEQGVRPNSDVMFGNFGSDVSLWAPGDGSDAFLGGSGKDAQVLGVIDRDTDNVPTLTGRVPTFLRGVPTANLTGSPGFCTVERVADPSFGYEFLVRFFVRATGALAVTIRLSEVEQVFCTSQAGGAITFADLTSPNPQFSNVDLATVRGLNSIVGGIVR